MRYAPHKQTHAMPLRRGSLSVEFAITLPLLFLLAFAALEICGMNVIRHTVDNAAYEAARRGIVPGATVADVTATANDIMAMVRARNVQVTVNPAVIDDDTPEIVVTVTVPVAENGWLPPRIFSAADTLEGQCRLLREEL